MKKSFSYDLTKYGNGEPTVTEQIKTSDGVKTITTDANTGAVILADSVDPDSLNPVTAAAVADAVASASGEVPVIGDGDNGKVLKAVVDGSSKSVAWSSDSDNAYVATYGTTTYQELSDAKAAGKAIFVTNVSGSLSAVMPMTSFSVNPAMAIFMLVIGDIEYQAKIDQGVWSSTSVSLQADWNESNQLAPSYIANKPTVDQIYDASSTNAQSGTAVAGAIAGVRQVPSTQSSDNGKVLGVTDSSGTLGWVSAGGGSSGYTPVDLNPITEGPYTIPVGNREDVYVQVSGYTSSTVLNLQLANDCTDAIVTVNACGTVLDSIQVSRGNTDLQIYGRNTVISVFGQPYTNTNRVLLSTVDGGSDFEPPTDFSEIAVESEDVIIGDVVATDASRSLQWLFSIEIKGRCAILHTL